MDEALEIVARHQLFGTAWRARSQLVSKKRQDFFQEAAPSPCAAKLTITCGLLAVEQLHQQVELVGT